MTGIDFFNDNIVPDVGADGYRRPGNPTVVSLYDHTVIPAGHPDIVVEKIDPGHGEPGDGVDSRPGQTIVDRFLDMPGIVHEEVCVP